jgi:twitching motility protein PilT
VPIKKEDHLFGRLALHYKLVTRDQVNEALRQQSREGGERKVGEILIEKGWLSRDRFEQLLEVQRKVQTQAETQAQAPSPDEHRTPDRDDTSPAAIGQAEAEGSAESPPRTGPAEPTSGEAYSLQDWLQIASGQGASDLHIHSGQPVKLRVAGELVEASAEPLAPESAESLLRSALSVAQREELDQTGQVELAATVSKVGRYRGSVYRQQQGVDGVFRLISPRPPSLSDLGLPLDLARLANYHQGLVLVTGPAGCGKSATLAALVGIVNRERPDHVITIEDPVEVVHRSQRSIVNQRQVGRHTESFDRALRAALREDPDVIVVGELRDLETISLALTAAETGHLVLATLHTTSAISTINRLVGVFPPNQQAQIRAMASESLRAVVCQRLARRADGEGRVPALEILLVTKAVSNLIRDNKTFQIRSVLQTGGSKGMRMLDGSLEELVREGTITAEEAQLHAENPERFEADGGDAPASTTSTTGGDPGGGATP